MMLKLIVDALLLLLLLGEDYLDGNRRNAMAVMKRSWKEERSCLIKREENKRRTRSRARTWTRLDWEGKKS